MYFIERHPIPWERSVRWSNGTFMRLRLDLDVIIDRYAGVTMNSAARDERWSR